MRGSPLNSEHAAGALVSDLDDTVGNDFSVHESEVEGTTMQATPVDAGDELGIEPFSALLAIVGLAAIFIRRSKV